VNHWVDGVPSLAWAQGKDCTFAGALEAALAPTLHPVPYAELMGYSGLAFRTRWFQNPARAPTVWGDQRWHPVSPHGEGPEEIAAISRATGWQLRAEELPAAAEDPARHRLITDIVLSINPGLPVVVGYNTDCATVHGYHIHSMSLFLRDYQRPGQEDVRVPSDDAKLHSPFVYLTAWREPPPAREALLNSLAIAVRNGRREDGDGFRYGLAALEAWREDLAGYDGHSGQERQLLFTVNWWCLMHLADARQAAVRFLEARADLLDGESRAALGRALDRYRAEAEALGTFARDQREFIMWWGGRTGAPRWDGATRQAQQDLLGTCQALESQALVELEQVLASEGVARG